MVARTIDIAPGSTTKQHHRSSQFIWLAHPSLLKSVNSSSATSHPKSPPRVTITPHIRERGRRHTIGFLSAHTPRVEAIPSPAFKIVSIYPGETEFTRMPYRAHSAARQFFNVKMAALETLYATCGCGKLTLWAEMEAMNVMLACWVVGS